MTSKVQKTKIEGVEVEIHFETDGTPKFKRKVTDPKLATLLRYYN